MRLWSIHPKYLDSKALVATWREGLLALEVLKGNTRGYTNHPQLIRFRATSNPVMAVTCYLWHIHLESEARGYKFNARKLAKRVAWEPLTVTRGQLSYEMDHLRRKLMIRNQSWYKRLEKVEVPDPHPQFLVVDGDVEEWEKK